MDEFNFFLLESLLLAILNKSLINNYNPILFQSKFSILGAKAALGLTLVVN